MNIFSALYTLIITPIETIIEAVFSFELTIVGFMGAAGAIITVSLAVGFLTLPIYNVADAIQKKERDTQAGMAAGIKRIKETFTGDERFMMMQTFYREHHWSPVYALRSSLSILIEIPFFIAAYHFLSHCSALQGAGFGSLADLGAPDALIALGALHLNLLPILMTAINAVSSAVYLKGFTLREKAQTYCLALIFLVLLYNSPAGLVFYWTLNNLFSLAKNVVQRWVKRPGRLVHIVITAMMLLAGGYIILFGDIHNPIYRAAAIALPLLVGVAPVCIGLLRDKSLAMTGGALSLMNRGGPRHCERSEAISSDTEIASQATQDGGNRNDEHGAAQAGRNRNDGNARLRHSSPSLSLLVFSCLALALLCGLVLPANAIATNPVEFSFIGAVSSPLYYVWRNLAVFMGFFVLWPIVIYKMMGGVTQRIMPYLMALLLVMAVLDIVLFKYDYGIMTIYFKLDDADVLKNYGAFYTLFPLLAALGAAALLLVARRANVLRHLCVLVAAVCFAEAVYGLYKVVYIKGKYNEYVAMNPSSNTLGQADKITPEYHLSKDGRNVIVFFVDSAISALFPYILQEAPAVESAFEGFVYYPNTVSQGGFTLIASPLMMGGYDYTVEELNKRPDVLLKDKHNEALLLLPRLFSDAGYHASVQDPPFCNYAWTGDAAPFAPYPNIECKFIYKNYYAPYINHMGDTQGASFPKPEVIIAKHSMAFCALQAAPPVFRSAMYDSSTYMQSERQNEGIIQYAHLYFLPELTAADAAGNTYNFICNDLPHETAILKEPDYELVMGVDEGSARTGYYNAKTKTDKELYHTNAGAIHRIADWLDRLRALGVYDNTRIIIVGDHGKGVTSPDEARLHSEHIPYNPLLLFKDFDAHGAVRTDNQFMTNGDVPFLAKEGLGLSNENPFTHKPMVQNKRLFKVYSVGADAKLRNAEMKEITTWKIDKATIYTVHDNIFDEDNWERVQ